jgi:hypothetical protein
MPVAQSPAHYINSSKGCPSITESFPLCCLLVLCAYVAALPVVQPIMPLIRNFKRSASYIRTRVHNVCISQRCCFSRAASIPLKSPIKKFAEKTTSDSSTLLRVRIHTPETAPVKGRSHRVSVVYLCNNTSGREQGG